MIGMQISPLNVITGTGMGVQLGIVNYVHDFYGAELGFLNITNNSYGLELGVLNFSDDMTGFQFGLINKANNMVGSQFGLINIADEQTGYSFGLLNFLLKTGQTKLSLWYDSAVPLNIAIKTGGKYFYSTIEVNYPNLSLQNKDYLLAVGLYPAIYSLILSSEKEAYYSLGIGGQIAIEPIWLALEV